MSISSKQPTEAGPRSGGDSPGRAKPPDPGDLESKRTLPPAKAANSPDRERELINAARQQAEAPPISPGSGESIESSTAISPWPGDFDSDVPPPSAFPGYKIVRKIHSGGQGVVYQAIKMATRRKVALKVIREGPFADPRNKARLERGIRILGQLDHPNIVGVIDSGVVAGTLYYVMDYVPGLPLDQHIERRRTVSGAVSPASGGSGSGSRRGMESSKRQRADINEMLRLFVKICDAVNVAHMRGIIHRDLKPGNILVDDAGEPHILDFDLAKVVLGDLMDVGDGHAMSHTGDFIGSLRWASPEQIERQPSKIDTRTDVYSLGVILYEMLTAQYPYPVVGSRRDIEDNILHVEPVRASTIRRHIDDDVDTVVLKCLDKERGRRYQTAGALAEDLQAYLRGEPIGAKRDSALYLIKKVIRRHAGISVAVTTTAAAVLGALVISLFWYHEKNVALARELQTAHEKAEHQVKSEVSTGQAVLAWFLIEWEGNRLGSARHIMNGWNPTSMEFVAMQALLDDAAPLESPPARLLKESPAVAYFVLAERQAKAGLTDGAIASLIKSLQYSDNEKSLFVRSAQARISQLRVLRATSSRPAGARP